MGTQPSQSDTAPPQFLAHVCCEQTVLWIKTALGMEVDLSPSDIVLNGDPAPPPPKGAQQPPLFSAHVYCGHTVAHLGYC